MIQHKSYRRKSSPRDIKPRTPGISTVDERHNRKESFACGKLHRTNAFHSREEVTAAVIKLKPKQPTACITVEDHVSITVLFDSDDDYCDGEEDLGDWEEKVYGTDKEWEQITAYTAFNDLGAIESNLSEDPFLHGISVTEDKHTALEPMDAYLATDKKTAFHLLRLYKCANRSSIMSTKLYHSYWRLFGLNPSIRP